MLIHPYTCQLGQHGVRALIVCIVLSILLELVSQSLHQDCVYCSKRLVNGDNCNHKFMAVCFCVLQGISVCCRVFLGKAVFCRLQPLTGCFLVLQSITGCCRMLVGISGVAECPPE